ncbi:MAG: NgoPII family restriction endonuclease [Methanobrevibacter sp.]|jgi:hypothetical protein|nr:NgoPII family restriction endonuclease [Methanobrevibacter sp.]
MYTNILKAIMNIKNLKETNIKEIYPPNSEINRANRINHVGMTLELLIKDSLCNSYNTVDKSTIAFNSSYPKSKLKF